MAIETAIVKKYTCNVATKLVKLSCILHL